MPVFKDAILLILLTFSGKQKRRTGRANTCGAEGEQVPHIRAFNFTQRSYLFAQTLSQTKNQCL